MAEIKSTLDIVMERTKGLRMSEADKEKKHEEELSQKAKGLCSRYLDGQLNWETVKADFQGREDRDRASIKKAFYNHLLKSLDIISYNDRASRAIEAMSHGRAKDTLKKVDDLSSSYFKARQKKQKKIRPELWARLAKKGISGTAVEPNVNDSQEWKALDRALVQEYREKLDDLRERLTASYDDHR